MSVTITDILRLPSMQGAKVVAGEENLNRIISCITVLENDELEFHEENSGAPGFVGTELAITGFLSIRDHLDKQCQCIQRLHENGQAGLILFYIGIGVPKLDERVAELAQSLGFPLICMPENRVKRRYGEVIYEVMEAVVRDEHSDTYFASHMMERISHLPKELRNMDSVLNMLRDRIRSSLFIADMSGNLLNVAQWPSGNSQPASSLCGLLSALGPELSTRHGAGTGTEMGTIRPAVSKTGQSHGTRQAPASGSGQAPASGGTTETGASHTAPCPAKLSEIPFALWKNYVVDENGNKLQLVLAKESGGLAEDTCWQAWEVVQTFLNIWSEKHGSIEQEELIKAILSDEPVKMRRIAEILKVDVTEFSTMWIFTGSPPAGMLPEIKAFLKAYSSNYIAATYEESGIAFINRCTEDEIALGQQMLRQLESRGIPLPLTICMNLDNTAEAQAAYLSNKRYFSAAKMIYRNRKIFTCADISFAQECSRIVEAGQDSIQEKLQVLRPLIRAEKSQELLETLKVYMLDAECSIAVTAERMFVHKNTIKYRISRLKTLFGYDIDRITELRRLYTAAALERLLEILKDR